MNKSVEACNYTSSHESLGRICPVLRKQSFDIIFLNFAAFVVRVDVEAKQSCTEGTDSYLGQCEFQNVNDQESAPDQGEEG